jgi:hypothetical protein
MGNPHDGSTKNGFFGEKTRQNIRLHVNPPSFCEGAEGSKNPKKKLGKRLGKARISG